MKCPNCDKEMKHSFKEWEVWGFAHWDCEHGDYCCEDKYYCSACRIKNINGKWTIPNKFLPTEKQKKTILFINNHLRMDLEALTKRQCWLDIGKYFDEAKKIPLHSSEYYEDLEEYFGFCEGDFC